MAPAKNPKSGASTPPVLETERLRLQPVTVHDAEFILRLFNDEAFIRYIGDREIRTLEQATEYLQNQLEIFAGTPQQLFVVRLIDNGTATGVCSLLKRDGLEDPDIGFAFFPEFRGQGYAWEATVKTLEYARNELGLRRIVAMVSPDNTKSISLLHKLGFREDGPFQLTPEAPPSILFVPDE